jgi:hypothetical protein
MTKQKLDNFYSILPMLVIMLAFLLRVYVSFFSGLSWTQIDTFSYFAMADAILAGEPYSSFPNGYPILIAVFKSVFGSQLVHPALICLNVILSTLIVWMTIVMARQITGSQFAACVAGLGIALYPIQLNYVRLLLTEVPTTFLLTLSVFLLLKRIYFSSGLVFYCATFLRSSLIPIFPLVIGYHLFDPDLRSKKSEAVRYVAGFLIGVALYSALILCGIVKPSTNLTVNLLTSSKPYNHDENFFDIERFTDEEKQKPFQTYINFALTNPAEYIKQRLHSIQELWGWPVTVDHIGVTRSLATKLIVALRIPLIILVIIGFCRGPRDFDTWILFFPIVSITLVHGMMHSSPRYTAVVEPCLIILAVASLRNIFLSLRQ